MTPQNGYNGKPDYDLIVIGSGPAGCAAALNAVKYGLSVLIITPEKENQADDYSRPSESLHPGVIGLINHIDALRVLEEAFTGNYEGIITHDAVHYFTDENQMKISGCHINKSIFTNGLLKRAADKNVAILKGESVTDFITTDGAVVGVRTDSGAAFSGKIIIDASGSKRIAGRLLGLETQFHSPPLLAWTGKVNDTISDKTISRFIPQQNGWTWLAPEDNSCTFTCLTTKGKHQAAVPDELSGECGKILKFNMRWRSYKMVAAEGILICGDAGAILDPAAGQGILNALHSGIKASETAVQCLRNPEQEHEFVNNYHDWFNNETHRKIAQLKAYYDMLQIDFTPVL
jgi:flavin-dependent dehydrogenase